MLSNNGWQNIRTLNKKSEVKETRYLAQNTTHVTQNCYILQNNRLDFGPE